MTKLLLFLILVAGAGFAASFLAENAGSVTMFWFDYRIDTSVAFILICGVVAALVLTFLLQIIFAPSRFFARFFERRAANKLKLGIGELTYSVAALASSDIAAAEAHTKKVEKLLGRTPLTILLSAQIAKTKGDEATTNALLEQLLLHKETNYLAARSLSDNANKHDDLPRALELARQANQLNPKDSLSALQVLNLQVRLKQWKAALATVQNLRIPRKERNRLIALISIVRGRELLADGHNEEALGLARYALSKLPYFAPAADFAARVYSATGDMRKAENILKKAKKHSGFGEDASAIFVCRICAGSQKEWALHCNHCHSFDSLEPKSEIYGQAE